MVSKPKEEAMTPQQVLDLIRMHLSEHNDYDALKVLEKYGEQKWNEGYRDAFDKDDEE